MRLEELDYALPSELIAQAPAARRDDSRLLVLESGGAVSHHGFRELPVLLKPSLFVFNNTKVFPARVHAKKPTGGKVEFLLVERLGSPGQKERWLGMGRGGKGLRPGVVAHAGEGALRVEVVEKRSDGQVELLVEAAHGAVRGALDQCGAVPLPPYVTRSPVPQDDERYQTVYAKEEGAIAAPTAGLHFTKQLISTLRDLGHATAEITLHVGPGTFRPVQESDLDQHPMHEETYVVDADAAESIVEAQRHGRRIVAVGTTVVRTLEAIAAKHGHLIADSGRTRLFIRPPFEFRVVDDLVTNFHLPRSTLLALVMAFSSPDAVRQAYREAIANRYRFYSYGDAMLLRGRA